MYSDEKEELLQRLFETPEGLALATITHNSKSDNKLVSNSMFNEEFCDYVKSKGIYRPRNLKENVLALLEYYKITVKYNEISKNSEIEIPGKYISKDNFDEVSLEYILNKCIYNGFLGLSKDRLNAILLDIADDNRYNPVKNYFSEVYECYKTEIISSGIKEIKKLCNTIVTSQMEPELKNMLIIKWLLICVSAGLSERGFSSHGVLTLNGPQGIGKSTWVRSIVPNKAWFKDGVTLDPNSKDSVLTAIQYWIVELGELESTLKKDIAALKSFFTKDIDVVRRPFARKDSHYARRTVFCASVNSEEFLKDETGNRRFWIIPVEKIDYNHDVDIHLMWAEVVHLFLSGEKPFLTQVEDGMLSESNKIFQVKEIVDAKLDISFLWNNPERYWLRAADVYKYLGEPHGVSLTSISKAIRKRSKTWEISKDYKVVRGDRYYALPKGLYTYQEPWLFKEAPLSW